MGKSLSLSGPQFSTYNMVGVGLFSEMVSATLSCLMLCQQKNSNSSLAVVYDWILFPFGLTPRASTTSLCPLLLSPFFVLLPETKPPARLLSRQLGLGPASQMAAETQMKRFSEDCLWLSAQLSPTQAWQPWAQLSHKASCHHSHTRLPL